MTERIESQAFVYKHLVCEYGHWDQCLVGLLYIDDEFWLCRIIDAQNDKPQYRLEPLELTPVQVRYLLDYAIGYRHWFYIDGARPYDYDGSSMEWFHKKWQDRNPVFKAGIRSSSPGD